MRIGPVAAGLAQTGQVVRGKPIVVVEIGNMTTIGEIAEDRPQRAAEPIGMKPAMTHRGRIARIDDRQVHPGRTLGPQHLKDCRITLGDIDTDQDLDPARQILGKDGPHGLQQGWSQDRRHDDGGRERRLECRPEPRRHRRLSPGGCRRTG